MSIIKSDFRGARLSLLGIAGTLIVYEGLALIFNRETLDAYAIIMGVSGQAAFIAWAIFVALTPKNFRNRCLIFLGTYTAMAIGGCSIGFIAILATGGSLPPAGVVAVSLLFLSIIVGWIALLRSPKGNDDDWPFDQARKCAAFSLRPIVFDGEPILHVTHDADDHGWQFLGSGGADIKQAAIVAMEEIVAIDASVLEIADLPPGWHAWRSSRDSPWQRAPKVDVEGGDGA